LEQKDAIVQTSIEKISKAMTRTEMNIKASDNIEMSEKIEQLIAKIERSEWISNSQKKY